MCYEKILICNQYGKKDKFGFIETNVSLFRCKPGIEDKGSYTVGSEEKLDRKSHSQKK